MRYGFWSFLQGSESGIAVRYSFVVPRGDELWKKRIR
jgi:hypothetical protein